MMRNLLLTDMKRAIGGRGFWWIVLALVGMEFLSCGRSVWIKCDIVMLIENLFSGTASVNLLLMLMPLVPYALVYAKDESERAAAFWVIRCGAKRYMASKFIVGCMAAFLCVVLSFVVFCVILYCGGYPLATDYLPENGKMYQGYYELLYAGNSLGYLGMYIVDRGLGGMMMSACAVFLAAMSKNQFIALTGPLCLYYVVLRISSDMDLPEFMRVTNWIEDTYDAPGGAWEAFFCKIMVSFLVCVVFGILSVYIMKKRWEDA